MQKVHHECKIDFLIVLEYRALFIRHQLQYLCH